MPVCEPYTEPLPDYGDLMTVAEFRNMVELNYLTDDDGYGRPVRNGKMRVIESNLIYPSNYGYFDVTLAGATHIVWFNR